MYLHSVEVFDGDIPRINKNNSITTEDGNVIYIKRLGGNAFTSFDYKTKLKIKPMVGKENLISWIKNNSKEIKEKINEYKRIYSSQIAKGH